MRIIIDLEGIDADPTTLHPHVTIQVSPPRSAALTAPPEVLLAAAALGAEDAGSAPARLAASSAAIASILTVERGPLVAGFGHTAAGPAPEVASPGALAAELGKTAAGKAPRRTAKRSASSARSKTKGAKTGRPRR